MSSKIWTRDFSLAMATNTFVALVFYMLMGAVTLFAAERFAANDTMAGLASSMFVIGSVAARVYAGKLLDVVGRKRMLLVGLLGFVAMSLVYLAVDSLSTLLVVRFVHGMAFGAANTAVAASVQTLIPPQRRSEGTGYFGLSTTMAMAVGPLLAVSWGAQGEWDSIFLFCTVASVLGFVVAYLLKLPEYPASAQERARWWRLGVSDVFDRSAMPIATVMLLAGTAYSSVLTFLTTYAVYRDMPQAASGFFMAYAVTVLVTRLFVGRVQDRLGDNAVMYPTLLAFALSLLLLAVAPNALAVIGAGVLAGFGFGAMMSCGQAIVAAQASPARMGVVTSTFFIMLDLGAGLGPVLLGGLVTSLGFEGMYVAMAALTGVAAGLYWLLHGRLKGGRRRAPEAPLVSEAGTSAEAGRRVLVGFDGSPDGLRALRYGARAALAAGYDLWVVAAVGQAVTGELNPHADAGDAPRRGEVLATQIRAELTELRMPAEQTVLEIVAAHPVQALTERSERAVLLILGRRSTAGLERMFVGSTSLGVVAGARCPVMVISQASTPQATGRHGVVAVAIGARGGDRGALAWGLAEARRREALLRVVHVMRPGADESELRERALARLEELSPGYADVEIVVDLPHETGRSTVDQLVELSRSSDVLVLDGRGNRVTGVPLGGAVRGVLAHAECPVVLAG